MLQHQRQPPTLLEQGREAMRTRHSSQRTAETSLHWITRFPLLHGKRHPRDLGTQEVPQLLSHRAVARHVVASTQPQAFRAILLLSQQVLNPELDWVHDVVRAQQPQRLPVVVTQAEVPAVVRHRAGVHGSVDTPRYGAGLRLLACLRLRVQDRDLASHPMVVRTGTSQKDWGTMMPQQLQAPLPPLQDVTYLHAQERAAGGGTVSLADALARKDPHAHRAGAGQEVLPAA